MVYFHTKDPNLRNTINGLGMENAGIFYGL
jgi:hypothetical protein